MKVHFFAALIVITAGITVNLAVWEWFVVLILIGLVISLELVNSAIEELADVVKDCNKLNYRATKNARDLAAGAVLFLALVSAVIGLWIFLPKFF